MDRCASWTVATGRVPAPTSRFRVAVRISFEVVSKLGFRFGFGLGLRLGREYDHANPNTVRVDVEVGARV